ncbi:MAG: helix-turn-helix domain-containing protein [Rikenellaceae bacterium]
MSKIKLLDNYDPHCPVRNILSRIGDKWSILVLLTLSDSGTIRFKELQRSLPDISQKMLTVTLRTLEEDGLVSREVFAVVPPKVEYTLTDRARSLLPHIFALTMWAKENMTSIIDDRNHRQTVAVG